MDTLTVRVVADRLGTTDRTVRRWIAERKLTATRTADGWTVCPSDLDDFLVRRVRADPADGLSGSVRPSDLEPLTELLREATERSEHNAAAAAMWQGRAMTLDAELQAARGLLRALQAPQDPPQTAQDAQEGTPSRSAIQTSVAPSESPRPRPGLWTRLRAALHG